MEQSGFNILENDRCENLRWKGMFIHADADPNSDDHIFWCLKTQIALGPDGNLVNNYECNPLRQCFRGL